jgi:signal transduction histidine kinase
MKDVLKNTGDYLPREEAEGFLQTEERVSYGSKAAFVRQASHEIQGAFFGVSSICAMLKLSIENKEETGILLDHLMDACQTYKSKLSNFIEFSRFDAGLSDTRFESINVRHLLNRVVNEIQDTLLEKGTEINLSISDEMPEQILSDEFRIAQICTNLLSNAVNFSPAGSVVLIQVQNEGDDSWAIVVENKGEGMTAETLNSVFKFSTSERHTLKNPGGLGLFVTRYLVEDVLNGKIILSSRPHVGTVCKVVLPLG